MRNVLKPMQKQFPDFFNIFLLDTFLIFWDLRDLYESDSEALTSDTR